MLGGIGQHRRKVSLARVPPWRRWIRARESPPDVSKTSQRLPVTIHEGTSYTKRLLSQSVKDVKEVISTIKTVKSHDVDVQRTLSGLATHFSVFRQSMASNVLLRKDSIQNLDEIANQIRSELVRLPAEEKVRVIGVFGGLVDFKVHNRTHDRYNTKPLLYQNSSFYSELVSSIDWCTIYSSSPLGRTRTLSPLLTIVRSINRMGLSPSTVHAVLNPLLSDVVSNLPIEPKPVHLVELVSICSKNKLVHRDLFSHVISELAINFNSFHEDFLGDILRSFTNLRYSDSDFHSTLEQMLPARVHELAWWNLVDLGDYYATCCPSPDSPDMIARISNEVWKWIPDMRSGYAAKALRVLSELDSGDERTRRSLIRAIPKSLGKMHPQVAAETIIAAAKVNYSPRYKYGKRYGSVFYRRVAARLLGDYTDPTVNPLEKVSPRLIVQVVESLASVDRPIPELFDAILEDYNRGKKYTSDQLVTMERILCDKFQYEWPVIQTDEKFDQSLSTSNLAYLARSNETLLPKLFHQTDVSVADVVGLIKANPDKVLDYAQSEWLDRNLTNMTCEEFKSFVSAIACAQTCALESTCLALLVMKANDFTHYESLSSAVEIVSSILILSNYDFDLIGERLWKQVTSKPVIDLQTITLCQLISGHMRLSSSSLTDSMSRFCKWIESHLVSKYRHHSMFESHWFDGHVPAGFVKDLSVFPVLIPLALPNSNIDLRKLHSATNPTTVRRIFESQNDSGIAVFGREPPLDLVGIMQVSYLTKLGWKVRYVQSSHDTIKPGNLSHVLGECASYIPTNGSIHSILS